MNEERCLTQRDCRLRPALSNLVEHRLGPARLPALLTDIPQVALKYVQSTRRKCPGSGKNSWMDVGSGPFLVGDGDMLHLGSVRIADRHISRASQARFS